MIIASRPRYFVAVTVVLRWPLGFGWGKTIRWKDGRSWVLSLGLVELTLTVVNDDFLYRIKEK